MKKLLLIILASLMLSSCSENYSNGERIGLVTQFSKRGILFKSWEGHLNLTQTGMNSSNSAPFDFSIDRDNEEQKVISLIDSAANYGWKIKIIYHQTFGWNWFSNRGETNHFVKDVIVLDKDPIGNAFGNHQQLPVITGKVIDTIYVVIDRTK